MQFYGFAVAVGVLSLGACAGGEKKPADTTHVAVDTSTSATTTTTTTPATSTSGAAAMAPITGTTKTVNMVGDAKGYRFEPASITIKQGDGIKFVVVSAAHTMSRSTPQRFRLISRDSSMRTWEPTRWESSPAT